jgi:hypothetical protein
MLKKVVIAAMFFLLSSQVCGAWSFSDIPTPQRPIPRPPPIIPPPPPVAVPHPPPPNPANPIPGCNSCACGNVEDCRRDAENAAKQAQEAATQKANAAKQAQEAATQKAKAAAQSTLNEVKQKADDAVKLAKDEVQREAEFHCEHSS